MYAFHNSVPYLTSESPCIGDPRYSLFVVLPQSRRGPSSLPLFFLFFPCSSLCPAPIPSLGAGDSGKSTLFKQMTLLYGSGFSADDRKAYAPVIYNNIIEAMQTIVEFCFDNDIKIEKSERADTMLSFDPNIFINEEVGQLVRKLWKDKGVKTAYKRRNEYQLNDSAKYYFRRIKEIWRDDYIPSMQDVLRCRIITTGMVEQDFKVGDKVFKMCDVGGQRNHRAKWIHLFDNVTAIIFVAAISGYDQVRNGDVHILLSFEWFYVILCALTPIGPPHFTIHFVLFFSSSFLFSFGLS